MKDNLKVTIGCRVEYELREKLIEMQKEGKYNSFSQFLEDLIIKAVEERENLEDEPKEAPMKQDEILKLLKELQQDQYDTEDNILEAIDNIAVGTSKTDDLALRKTIENEFIARLLKLLEFNPKDPEHFSIFQELLFDEETTIEKFIEVTLIKERQDEWLDNKLDQRIEEKNLLPIALSPESKELVLEYYNYLVKNEYAVSLEGALVGSLYYVLKLNKGGFLKSGFHGWDEYLEKFEEANERIINELLK